MLIVNANVWNGKGFEEKGRIRTGGGRVTETGRELSPRAGERILDAEGDTVLPGFVDVHIHAFRGRDTMAGEEAVRAMSRSLFAEGVAAFCPTTMSASPEETARALRGIQAVMDRPEPEGARVLGAHMEAPFLSPARAGAQRKECFRLPAWESFLEMTGGRPESVRLITVAPELAGSEAFIRKARAAGVRVSLGHTAADGATVHRAGDWGADHVTHLFNAQTPLHHREPGVPGAALTDDRFFCELICDGIHLHPDIIRLAVRAAGAGRVLAVTDAMEAAGMPEGIYQLGGQEVVVRGGEARLRDGTLAGSVLTMKEALGNLIRRFGIPPETACAMVTETPAASVGEAVCGRLIPGSPLPLTRWSPKWEMKEIIREDQLPVAR
ncbi:MAG: N-acetylglucosamine-6-phosphate deacetylase [Clostridia bacterium]|nr:N-acetylglucosamine-6-phosphate deacetylase [Clostridia bacterium]